MFLGIQRKYRKYLKNRIPEKEILERKLTDLDTYVRSLRNSLVLDSQERIEAANQLIFNESASKEKIMIGEDDPGIDQ